MLARRARTPLSWEHVFDFRRCDVALSSLITYNRPDASTCATRRRVIGAVGPSRTNDLTYSGVFSNAAWVKTNVTLGAGVADPRGGTTAFTLTAGAALGQLTQTLSAGASLMRVNSLWLRRRTGTSNVNLWSPDVGTPLVISALPSTWTRYEAPNASAATARTLLLELTATGDEVDIWEGQLELGGTATPNIPTTSAPVTTTDWPRTNYIGKSNKFTDAVWGRAAAGTGVAPIIVSESVAGPNGRPDATRITFNQGAGDTLGDSSQLNYYQSASLTTGASYCAGIWARIPLGVTIAVRSVGTSSYMAMVGTGDWKRYERPETAGSAFAAISLGLRGGLGIGASTGSVTVDLWHCTLEDGSELTATIPNDTTAPLTVNTPPYGQMTTVAANVPVLEYDKDGIGRGLRVESGSRNLAASSGFLDGIDDPSKVLAEPGFPDSSGGYNAFRIRATGSSGILFAQQVVPTTGELVAQIVLKRGNSDTGGNEYGFYNTTTAADLAYVFINYATGVLVKTGPLSASLTATAVPCGDNLDWWLLTLKLATGFSASDVLNFYMGYLGGGATIGSFHYIDWVQVEPGLVPTSYIKPVISGTVPVRAAASALMVPSTVGLTTTSGSVLIDCEVGNTNGVLWQLGSAGGNTLHLARDGNTLRVWCNRADVAELANVYVGTPFASSDRVRVAVAWSAGRIYVVVNGAEPNIFNASVPTSFADSALGYYPYGGGYQIDGLISELRTTSRTLSLPELVRESAL